MLYIDDNHRGCVGHRLNMLYSVLAWSMNFNEWNNEDKGILLRSTRCGRFWRVYLNLGKIYWSWRFENQLWKNEEYEDLTWLVLLLENIWKCIKRIKTLRTNLEKWSPKKILKISFWGLKNENYPPHLHLSNKIHMIHQNATSTNLLTLPHNFYWSFPTELISKIPIMFVIKHDKYTNMNCRKAKNKKQIYRDVQREVNAKVNFASTGVSLNYIKKSKLNGSDIIDKKSTSYGRDSFSGLYVITILL